MTFFERTFKRSGVIDRFIFTTILIILLVITLFSIFVQIKKDWVNQDYIKITFNVACDSLCKDITILCNENPANSIEKLSLVCNNSVVESNLEKLFSPNNFGYRLDIKLENSCVNLKLKGIDKLSGKERIYYIQN